MPRKSKAQADKDWAEAKGRSRMLRKLNHQDKHGGSQKIVKSWMIGKLECAILHHYGSEGLPETRSYISAGCTGDSKLTLDEAVDMELAELLEFTIHNRPQSIFSVTPEGRALVGPVRKDKPIED